MKYLQLGASLYVPSTREDLVAIGNRCKYPLLRSVIFCTEDSIEEKDVNLALDRLASALAQFEPTAMLRFIRVRSPEVLKTLLRVGGIERVDGFVLPKVTRHNFHDYFLSFAPNDPFEVMVTLETVEVFDASEMAILRDLLMVDEHRRRVLSLRIGGNDLFKLLGLRRPRRRSIYDTPLAVTIAQLATTFRPYGLNLTAPVFEYLDAPELLAQEVDRDLEYGLFGKTAIHPDQIAIIEARYRVTPADLEMAHQVLSESALPVFRLQGAMCEPATHRKWATLVVKRAKIYGMAEPE